MKTIEKILDVITAVIVAMAIILLLPWIFGVRPYIVMSGSMAPSIPKWSLAYVDQKATPEVINEGDVLAYHLGGETVTHRVVGMDDDGFITKGDANDKADLGTVSKDRIIGREVFSIPYLGYLIYCLRSALGLVIAAAIILGYVVVAVFSDKRNTENSSRVASENSETGKEKV